MLLDELRIAIGQCRECVECPVGERLAHEPRPVVVLSPTARIAICGQAPGIRVHHSGKPFTDPSGERLRQWMGVSSAEFYDASKFAIVPMGFCFPGYNRHGGDLPPRRECKKKWHDDVFKAMPQVKLKLVIGGAAQRYHLGDKQRASVRENVLNWREYFNDEKASARILPLPHPSWRNNGWLKKNPWFEEELLPVLKNAICDYG